MKRIRVETRKDRKTGVVGRRVKRTSGDAALDWQVCDAVLACARTARKAGEMEGCLAPWFAGFANRHGGHTDPGAIETRVTGLSALAPAAPSA